MWICLVALKDTKLQNISSLLVPPAGASVIRVCVQLQVCISVDVIAAWLQIDVYFARIGLGVSANYKTKHVVSRIQPSLNVTL